MSHTHDDDETVAKLSQEAHRNVTYITMQAVNKLTCAPAAVSIAATAAAASLDVCARIMSKQPDKLTSDAWLYACLLMGRAFEPNPDGLALHLGPDTFTETGDDFRRLTGRSPNRSLADGLVNMLAEQAKTAETADNLLQFHTQRGGKPTLN